MVSEPLSTRHFMGGPKVWAPGGWAADRGSGLLRAGHPDPGGAGNSLPTDELIAFQPVWINPQRYRSQGRRERLEACKRFEIVGTMVRIRKRVQFC